MSEELDFVIFPYLRTSEPVNVCGFELRGTNDHGNLKDGSIEHLKVIRELFFIENHQRINEMAYGIIPRPSSKPPRLEKIQAMLALMYSSSDSQGKPFFNSDHSTYFIVRPESRTSKYQVTSDVTTNLWPVDQWPSFSDHGDAPGYCLLRNGLHYSWTFSGGRVYPMSEVSSNYSQDLYIDLILWNQEEQNWPLGRFFNADSGLSEDTELLLLNSLQWFARGIRGGIDQCEAILLLAVALESLLNLEVGDRVTERFVETVSILLGSTERLDAWANQFYEARSKIVHRGAWSRLEFYPKQKYKKKEVKSSSVDQQTYRTLLDFGLRIYRLCFLAILTGSYIAKRAKLHSGFVPNEERMILIKEVLEGSSNDPQQVLANLAQDVVDLDSYFYSGNQSVNLGLLMELVVSACRFFLTSGLETSDTVAKAAKEFLDASGSLAERYALIKNLDSALQTWRSQAHPSIMGTESGQVARMKDHPALVFDALIQYACHQGIAVQVSSAEWKAKKQ